METLLEQQRRYHEERERLMDGMVQVEFIILQCPLVLVLIEKNLTGASLHKGKPQRQHQ